MNSPTAVPFRCGELPELIEDFLEHKCARCCAFNRKGSLLAAGCTDGTIVLWDFETRGVALTLTGHKLSVVSLSWSRNGRTLVSAGSDQCLIQWDVAGRRELARVSVENTLTRVSLHPSGTRAVVSCVLGPPLLVDFAAGSSKPQPLPLLYFEGNLLKWKEEEQREVQNCSGIFNPTGTLLYLAAPKACLVVLDANTIKPVDVVKVGGQSRVLSLSLARKGRYLVVNSNDRVVRVFETIAKQVGSPADCTPVVRNVAAMQAMPSQGSLLGAGALLRLHREFQNAEQKIQWRVAALTCDDTHLAAACLSKTDHHIYIFNRESGRAERILEGPHEGIADMVWHPVWPLLLTVSSTNGKIYIWSKVYSENWSAFAPDFKELTQNVEYVEREDEFDLVSDGEDKPEVEAEETEDEDIDVVGRDDNAKKLFSSDDEEDTLDFIPVTASDVGSGKDAPGSNADLERPPATHNAATGDGEAGTNAEGMQDAEGVPSKRVKLNDDACT